ncbi:hypothetical protein [Paenibacillus sp. FJAT-26967]|uniref:hypothetical protein n=1 Tax=Paenibacillus sp. FJAT-26967 TaxID=1729690 RepID=UPI0008388B54|nr:hypothetical protein [Paenibacillus sp. FJAT-26967]
MNVTYYERDGLEYRRVEYENGSVVESGVADRIETIRLDSENVEDILFKFDKETDQYIEHSRSVRHSVLLPGPKSNEELEAENKELSSRLSDIELALAELFAV